MGDESEDEEAVLERRVAENGTLSDGDSSDGEGKDTGDAEEQGAWGGSLAGKGFERRVCPHRLTRGALYHHQARWTRLS